MNTEQNFAEVHESLLIENDLKLLKIESCIKKAPPEIDVVFKMDIGHTYPHMYVVNGAMAHVQISNGSGSIEYELDE
mgnify:CR=1 FL=1